MSALRHPSQREEMSAHCRHPERVSAKDPVIFLRCHACQSSSKLVILDRREGNHHFLDCTCVGDPLYLFLTFVRASPLIFAFIHAVVPLND